jgi:nitrite reductase/ring-hydroxylating ferredoxin subunit
MSTPAKSGAYKCIAHTSDVKERGAGLMFRVVKDQRIWSAFVIRYKGKAIAYLNACAHVGLRLNGSKNQFFDRDAKLLICTSHGATYEPGNGQCISGPCTGYGLIPLKINERNGDIYYEDEVYELAE